MELKKKQLQEMFEKLLDKNRRYRTLVFASNDLSVFPFIKDSFIELYPDALCLDNSDFYDEKDNVLSRSSALTKIKDAIECNSVLVDGPLQVCDVWSEGQQRVFWQELASFSSGSIVLLDKEREIVREQFRLLEKLKSIGITIFESKRIHRGNF